MCDCKSELILRRYIYIHVNYSSRSIGSGGGSGCGGGCGGGVSKMKVVVIIGFIVGFIMW